MKDNQNRDLEAVRKWQEIERKAHEAGVAASSMPEQVAEWTEIDGVEVLRIADDKFVAQPITGRRNARKFDIINIEAREYVCQVRKTEVYTWLLRAFTRV